MREPDTKLRPKVSDEEIDAIKRHSKRFVELAGGPEFFAPVSRVQKAALSKYGSLSEPEIMRCDVALALDREIGAPMMLGFLASLLGYRLVPAEEQAVSAIGVEDLADVAKETGDVVQKLAQALPGGIDAHESRDLRSEISQGIASLHRIDRKLAGGGA